VLERTLGSSRTLPALAYLSDDVLGWEIEHFFRDGWVCVGRADDLKNAGDQRAVRVGEEGVLMVRDEAKSYGTANRLEGAFEEGELVCLIEDIVTSGGALVEAISALREAGLVVRTARPGSATCPASTRATTRWSPRASLSGTAGCS
jgi:hypothetical protein